MTSLNIERKTIMELFSNSKTDFLIPDYQRPYAWEEEECGTLWDDIFDFAFPNCNKDKFDSENAEYFLGSIVIFKNSAGKLEVIDGQQRLTTIMLLLKAFHARFGNMEDENSKTTKNNLEKCIWKTDEFGKPKFDELKIDSEVMSDNNRDELLNILKNKEVKGKNGNYYKNYEFFMKKIDDFLRKFPGYFPYLPNRILNNCVLLPIKAGNQDTALRIFSTLNDRGKPLSDSDIFKAELYRYYSSIGKKEYFVEKWKLLEDEVNDIFESQDGTPMNELFTRYMYYERAKKGIKISTTGALRKFYEMDKYALLKREETFENLIKLANFWRDVENQNKDRFSERVLKYLFVLAYAPNGMWEYFVSVYFMHCKDGKDMLDEEKFCLFLERITAFIFAYAFINPGVNYLRTPVYAEMANMVEGRDVQFAEYKFDKDNLINAIIQYRFSNNRPLTKSMLMWWAFQQKGQELLSNDVNFQIEHIFAINRPGLKDEKNLEKLGNKSMLERNINIRASDYKFKDKQEIYSGRRKKGKKNISTEITELLQMSMPNSKKDFDENDILKRNSEIINEFIKYVEKNKLIK